MKFLYWLLFASYLSSRFVLFMYHFLAHLAEGHESLCHGAASVRHLVICQVSTFSFKWLLLKNH